MSSELECRYLGLTLSSPVVVGACPLTLVPESLRQMAGCGAGAVVLPSIFQEQIEQRDVPQFASGSSDSLQSYNGGPDWYLTLLRSAKQAVAIPVIASLNGYAEGDWLDFATAIQAAGADALELNVQPVITSPQQTGTEIESLLCDLVRRVCRTVSIPVAVKLTRHYTNPANMAQRLQQAGAAGLILFAHEVKWEVAADRLHWTPHWELTPIDSLGSTLAGIIQTRVAPLDLSIAASGGVRSAEDAVKAMIAGADVVMITSEIYRTGPEAICKIASGLDRYLQTSGYHSLADLHAARPVPQPRLTTEARRDYLNPLTRSDKYRDPTPESGHPTGDRFGHRD